ncbi:multidrug effflux MFS transporter [Conyzicola sp.]|uniref:multidrug effflux MFS transporter n=1 Tax=Conyzicola sp. TaxID=1969404 RepID=UPI003989C397
MNQRNPVGAPVVIAIGGLAVLGPFAIDMFLPSLPQMAGDLGVTAAAVQLTLTVYLVALGAGQLVAGPMADSFGRRRPLLFGLGAFIVGGIICAIAPSLPVLLAGRVLQGLGAALALVVANASVRDRTSGAEASRLFAVIMTIGGLGPVVAPAMGGIVDVLAGWRGVLTLMTLIGVVAGVLALVALKESLPVERRIPFRPAAIGRSARDILRSPAFLVPALALATAFMFLFVYIGGASFVYQDVFGLDPATFGLIFGLTGVAVVVGAVGSGVWMRSAAPGRVAVISSIVMLVGVILAGTLVGTGAGLTGAVIGMGVALLGLGAAEPALMTMVMGSGDHGLGMRAAVLGALQYLLAASATPLVGTLLGPDPTPWLIAMTGTALLAPAILLFAALRTRHAVGKQDAVEASD